MKKLSSGINKKTLLIIAFFLVSPKFVHLLSPLTMLLVMFSVMLPVVILTLLKPEFCKDALGCTMVAIVYSAPVIIFLNILGMYLICLFVYLKNNKERSRKEKIITLSALFLYYSIYFFISINNMIKDMDKNSVLSPYLEGLSLILKDFGVKMK